MKWAKSLILMLFKNEKSMSELKKQISFYTLTMIAIGSSIGSGIFKKAAPMASLLGSSELLLGVWVLTGIVTLFGALTNAEVTSMMPVTGGQYKYYQIMYGELIAFLCGWATFAVIQTGSIAAIAYVFSAYFDSIIQLPQFNNSFHTHRPQLVFR